MTTSTEDQSSGASNKSKNVAPEYGINTVCSSMTNNLNQVSNGPHSIQPQPKIHISIDDNMRHQRINASK